MPDDPIDSVPPPSDNDSGGRSPAPEVDATWDARNTPTIIDDGTSTAETVLMGEPGSTAISVERPAVVIGRYKLLKQLGQGGFGIVWQAEQTEPIRREVALKIIKLGMDSREIIARFEAERQALALMDHPNIASVLDAGTMENGRPYFVMELVKGVPITEYCDARKIGIRERLELFIPVCQAVQHAHQKAILHRDLKPSNILVTEVDGKPVPKVIDFGISKALGASPEEMLRASLALTQEGMIVGTPQYMSPEQAGSVPDVDTRSDIYTLGVILYELLVGETPLSRGQLKKAALDVVLRLVREGEPQRPSSRFIPATELGKTTASLRHTEPKKLGHALRGDLDWIVLKALEKDRAHRYDTANAFAQDLRRHLDDEPVSAGRPSAGYRLRKLLRRHRTAFATVSAVAVALIAGIAVSTWQAVRATLAERTAGEERTLAVTERDRALKAEAEAKVQRKLAEYNLYVDAMNLAQGAWEQANISRLREVLDETRTYPGRGFEWHYWQRQAHLQLQTLRGHTSEITSVAFSSDGRRMATASVDHTAKVWDAETGGELFTLKGHTTSVESVAFSPDGRRIVTASFDSTAKVWDADTGRELLTLKGHTAAVWSAAFSPDSRRIVTGSWDATAREWDADTGRELLTLNGHTKRIKSVAYSPDGRRIVTAGYDDNTAKIWDADTGRELLTFKGHTRQVWSVAFSPDSRRVVSSCLDNTAKTWDADTVAELLTLKGHSSLVSSAVFSPDGQRILTGSWDDTAKVWDAKDGRELLTLKGHVAQVRSVAFSPDGRRIITGSRDKTAMVWDAADSRERLTLHGHTAAVWSAAFSPDGRRIVTGGDDETARVWDAESGRELLTVKGHTASVGSVAFSPNGSRIVTGSRDNTAKVWDAETARELLTLTGHALTVRSVGYSPDGRRIVTGSMDKTAKVWDAETGRELLTLNGHAAQVWSVCFSFDGRRIVTGGADNTARVWDAGTGHELLTLNGHTSWVYSVAFSPDGRRIVTGSWDTTAKEWDAETGHELLTLKGHKSDIKSVVFSPDGRRILTGSGDKTAKLWDAETGRELFTSKGRINLVMSVAFSPDGQRIVIASDDHTATVLMSASPEEVEAWRKEEQPAAK